MEEETVVFVHSSFQRSVITDTFGDMFWVKQAVQFPEAKQSDNQEIIFNIKKIAEHGIFMALTVHG